MTPTEISNTLSEINQEISKIQTCEHEDVESHVMSISALLNRIIQNSARSYKHQGLSYGEYIEDLGDVCSAKIHNCSFGEGDTPKHRVIEIEVNRDQFPKTVCVQVLVHADTK